MATAVAGQVWPLYLNFYNMASGVLTDPTGAITLDITYGSEIGFVSDVAGPFSYAGGSAPSTANIYKLAVGQYAFNWQIPPTAQQGVYIANWRVVFGSNTYLVTEDFPVTGGFSPAQAATDTGYWTGSLDYEAPYGEVEIQLGQVDANGTAWLLKKVEGWDSPPAVGAVPQRSGDHGGWATLQTAGPRIITLIVLASAQSQALRDVARAQLQQVVPFNDLCTFTYNEPVAKQMAVRRNGGANITETYPTLCDVEFTIPLVAPDPRKYATQQQTVTVSAVPLSTIGVVLPVTVPFTLPAQVPTGSVAVTNGGTFETRPLITINGPMTAPSVTNLATAQTVSYSTLALGATDVLTVDLNARQGYLNGAFRPADLTSSWWSLQPGVNVIQLGGSTTGGGAMQITWSNTWI